MKYIIDLPEIVYHRNKKKLQMGEYDKLSFYDYTIAKGIPLDDVKAEINKIADNEQDNDKKWAVGLRHACRVINEYIDGEDHTFFGDDRDSLSQKEIEDLQ